MIAEPPARNHMDDLVNWIARATEALCSDAQSRIRIEIESHYRDAVVTLTESGLDVDAAHRATMRGLGDPVAALKAFRKTYLTSWQDELLADLRKGVKPVEAASSLGSFGLIAAGVSLMGLFGYYRTLAGPLPPASLRVTVGLLLLTPLLISLIVNLLRLAGYVLDRIRGKDESAFNRFSVVAFMHERSPRSTTALFLTLGVGYTVWLFRSHFAGMQFAPLWVPCIFAMFCIVVHRYVQGRLFSREWRTLRRRIVVTGSYIFFLVVVAVNLSVRLMPVWEMFVGPDERAARVYAETSPFQGIEYLVCGFAALALLVVSVRMSLGLHALRKGSGDGGKGEQVVSSNSALG
jgi:hypothetical protein